MTKRLHFQFSLSCIREGNGNPHQCSCLENPRDGEASWAVIYGVAQSQTRLEWLSSNSLIVLFLVFWKISIQFSKDYHTSFNFTSSLWRFAFSTPLPAYAGIILMIVTLTGMRWYLIVALICIFLMINNVGSEVKASAHNAGDLSSIPGLGSSPGEGNGNPLQHSCLGTPKDGGAWWATVHGVAKSRARLSDFTSQ